MVATNFDSSRASQRWKAILIFGGRFWFPILLPRGQATLESRQEACADLQEPCRLTAQTNLFRFAWTSVIVDDQQD